MVVLQKCKTSSLFINDYDEENGHIYKEDSQKAIYKEREKLTKKKKKKIRKRNGKSWKKNFEVRL